MSISHTEKVIPPRDFLVESLEVKFGLPKQVLFCKTCVMSNQRPNSTVEFHHSIESKKSTLHLNEAGICDACLLSKKKEKEINWQEREKQLIELCNQFRRHDGAYDCIVSGSGGKDSFYTAHILKYKYGMHPLTVTWAPHIYTTWGWQNLQAWIHAGFDNHLVTSNGRVHRLLTRLATEKLFHPFQPFILGQKMLAPKLAASYNIPLVFYGDNEAEHGNPLKDNNSARRDRAYFVDNEFDKIYLAGVSIKELLEEYGLNKNDILHYLPSDSHAVEKVEVHYLGYYLPWHPQGVYYYAVEQGGFQPSSERTAGTYSKYSGIDDKVDDFHYYTTFIKFGIGRATYDAAQEIRNGDITREEGVALVKKYDGEYPARFAEEVFRYLSINEKEFPNIYHLFQQPAVDKDYFLSLVDQFRSPHLWENKNGQWYLRHTVYEK